MFLNEIVINQDGSMLICGALAHSHVKLFRKELLTLRAITRNKFYVYEANNSICRAAQSTRIGALEYMKIDRVLVEIK